MDNDVDMQGPSPRLSPRAHGIAHASDRSGAQACDPSHWNDAQDNGGRVSSLTFITPLSPIVAFFYTLPGASLILC
jgi:hypothetical protein